MGTFMSVVRVQSYDKNFEIPNFAHMKMVELLKLAGETLKVMSENDVLRDDWRFVPMYEEFHHMRSMGIKYSEVIRILAEDYCIGRSTVERAIRRLSKEC